MAPKSILVHAHRGGRAFRPENTLPAFHYGILMGADVLELDLAVTRDDVLVVSHSPYLTAPQNSDFFANERICTGPPLPAGTPIHELTLAELRKYDCGSQKLSVFPTQQAIPNTPIPTLDEVFELAPLGSFDFNIETKIFPKYPELTPTPEMFVRLIDASMKRHRLQSRVILQSFDFRTLTAMRAAGPSIRRSALIGDAEHDMMMGLRDSTKDFASISEVSELKPGDFFSPAASFVEASEVAWAHAHGYSVAPWTVNDPHGWSRMAEARVDAVITDDPAGLLKWLRMHKPPLHA